MLNRVTIHGRLTADPMVQKASTGSSYVNFSIACERDYKAEGKERETDFIDVRAFKGTAEFICRYFTRGSQMIVDGRLQRDTWQDRETGKNRSKLVVIAENVYFGGSKRTEDSGNAEVPEQPEPPEQAFFELPEDSSVGLPF